MTPTPPPSYIGKQFPENIETPETVNAQYILNEKQNEIRSMEMRAQSEALSQRVLRMETEADILHHGDAQAILEYKLAEYKKSMPIEMPPNLLDKATSFLSAMASAIIDERPSKEAQMARLAICVGCDAFEIEIQQPKKVGWCKACGCGKNPLSALSVKASIKKSTCPKNLWDQPAQADAPSIQDEASPTIPAPTDAETP